MSAKWTFWAWDMPIKTAPKKLALLQLANNADDDGKSWYSIGKMAIACGVSERTFQRQIQSLESDGLLVVDRRSNRPSVYVLKDEVCIKLTGVTDCRGDTVTGQGVRESPLGVSESRPILTTNPNTTPNNIIMCENAFDVFYSAGLVKKSKVKALSLFKSLVKQMDCDPMEFAELLKSDVQYRINNNQFGIDKLHPATYLNQQRWTDEHDSEKSNNGYAQGDRKLSASERIRASNELKYGSQQPSSGLGMATDGRDIREPVDQGEWREALPHVEDRS